MTDAALVALPPIPTTLDEARSFLSWIAGAALAGTIGRDQALGAVKAVEAWVRVENYSRAIADLRRQLLRLQKTAKPNG